MGIENAVSQIIWRSRISESLFGSVLGSSGNGNGRLGSILLNRQNENGDALPTFLVVLELFWHVRKPDSSRSSGEREITRICLNGVQTRSNWNFGCHVTQ